MFCIYSPITSLSKQRFKLIDGNEIFRRIEKSSSDDCNENGKPEILFKSLRELLSSTGKDFE